LETANRQELPSGVGFCIQPTTNDESAMAMHEMSMDKNPFVAATGRAAKHLFPAFEKWMGEEDARGTHPREITNAAISMAASIAISAIGRYVRPAHVQDHATDAIVAIMHAMTDGADKLVAAAKKEQTTKS
jgi:CRISPR/Cas system-associated endonuclease Cas1